MWYITKRRARRPVARRERRFLTADGSAGGDYLAMFTIDAPTADTVTIGIPDYVRGPGQPVNLPADAGGIPLAISNGDGVRSIELQLAYDPSQLQINAATVAPGLPSGATATVSIDTPGLATIVFASPIDLPPGARSVVDLQASVPAGVDYGLQQVLDLRGVPFAMPTTSKFPRELTMHSS